MTGTAPDWAALEEVERRVLWLATRIVDAANHDRESSDGIKVGPPMREFSGIFAGNPRYAGPAMPEEPAK